jgi:DNA mismatch repair ATPase MutS
MDVPEIESRQHAVEEAKAKVPIRRNIREKLKSVYDLERLGSKLPWANQMPGILLR